jgi:hypothetical protein
MKNFKKENNSTYGFIAAGLMNIVGVVVFSESIQLLLSFRNMIQAMSNLGC